MRRLISGDPKASRGDAWRVAVTDGSGLFTVIRSDFMATTPPKINIEPENDSLEDVFPFPGVYCQVPC